MTYASVCVASVNFRRVAGDGRIYNQARTICAIQWYSAGNFQVLGEARMGVRSRRVRQQLLCAASALAALLFVFRPLILAHAQDKNPLAKDPNAAKLGEFEFRANCAFCHGLGARGGGRGPDLTRIQKKHGNSDADIFRTINEGVPGTAMPPNGATQQGVGMTEEEIWQVIAYLRSVQVKSSVPPAGNAVRGKELFNGSAACAGCHMMEGKGGRLGPDLTATGTARSVDYIVDSVRNPSRRLAQGITEAMKEFSQEYETVYVVDERGQKFQGVVLNEDNFTLQMIDTREQVHLFEKEKLRSVDKSRESLMPKYDDKMLPEKDLQDIVAYLLSQGTRK